MSCLVSRLVLLYADLSCSIPAYPAPSQLVLLHPSLSCSVTVCPAPSQPVLPRVWAGSRSGARGVSARGAGGAGQGMESPGVPVPTLGHLTNTF